LLDVHGKIQMLLVVWALPDRLLLLTPPGQGAALIEALDKYLFSEKAYLREASGELALLMLVGPQASALAERLTGASPPSAAWSHLTTALDGVQVQLVRGGGELAEDEIWLMAASSERERLRQRLVQAGARPVGLAAREALRIEAGTPLHGQDVDASVLLPEIPLDHLVSGTKGCYLGQEVVVRIRDRGHVNRHLRGLALEGDTVPASGATVQAGEAAVGHVTSAAWSFGLERPVALAFIRRQHADPGTAVVVRSGERTQAAAVTALPFPR
jgi:aminomethyltransferase